MAKFYGTIGFVVDTEVRKGVFVPVETPKTYRGDFVRNSKKWQTGISVNDDLNVNNEISIVADNFAFENFAWIRYVEYSGVRWKVTAVDIQRPRLILTIGGVYNGQQSTTASGV